jgi:uncharacterized protein
MLFSRLMPQEGRFFELFNSHAEQIVAGARQLVAMLTDRVAAQIVHHAAGSR